MDLFKDKTVRIVSMLFLGLANASMFWLLRPNPLLVLSILLVGIPVGLLSISFVQSLKNILISAIGTAIGTALLFAIHFGVFAYKLSISGDVNNKQPGVVLARKLSFIFAYALPAHLYWLLIVPIGYGIRVLMERAK